jgi:dissimilatory sulfite reductase (desulfoviridin) alpha/beta subunit
VERFFDTHEVGSGGRELKRGVSTGNPVSRCGAEVCAAAVVATTSMMSFRKVPMMGVGESSRVVDIHVPGKVNGCPRLCRASEWRPNQCHLVTAYAKPMRNTPAYVGQCWIVFVSAKSFKLL